MSRQYFADTLTEPLGAAYTTITATSETVLIPTALTPIPANEPRAGKIYELQVGGTVALNATPGTLLITPRYGLVIGGTSLQVGTLTTQTLAAQTAIVPFLFTCLLTIRSVGLPGANSTVIATGQWTSPGVLGTASAVNTVMCGGLVVATVDVSVASGLWIGVTFSNAPSVIPQWHVWRSLN